ncbi:MAG: YidC/Oxa1 family insertase periplasmic-domain containing protein [Phycisphaeraceae bacterium]|nr:YidC/Oxa1 family insertase periplasmic-domain containing protein [Phycisphaeraceae bacterium]
MMRILVPILALSLAVVVMLSFALRQDHTPPPPPALIADEQATTQAETTDAEPAEPAEQAAEAPPTAPPIVEAVEQAQIAPVNALHVLPAADADAPIITSIGSDDPDSPYAMRVDLVAWGAGYKRITLSHYSRFADTTERYVIAPPMGETDDRVWAYPLAAHQITVNGSQPLALFNQRWTLTDHGEDFARYELTLADESDKPLLTIVRRYALTPDSYDLHLDQSLVNKTDQPLKVVFRQLLQGDTEFARDDYLGDRRQLVTGFFNSKWDPTRSIIFIKDATRLRSDLFKKPQVWPWKITSSAMSLAWLSVENRYFALIVHPAVPDDAKTTSDLQSMDQLFADYGLQTGGQDEGDTPLYCVLTAATGPLTIAAGQEAELDLALFAGPRDRHLFTQTPYDLLWFGDLIRYEMSCTWCTFQWLGKFLLWFLEVIHAVVFDWGVAIIILVLIVRLLLHPLTKKAQINMMKVGKQMQLLAPEMEKIKKKYKDDQTRINQEVMKLYKEKGVNPMGMAGGCLPMFLQMPIWIALYAMLYFAIELRQQPAFYGIFQAVSGGNWHFLRDLSQADNFIRFVPMGDPGFKLNLWLINPHFAGINVLPLLMAVVFYYQQKLTTPPPANEQAAQQQKMMKWMILLFPIMLYSAPSGLTLYIMASTAAGILDSYVVRKHIKEQEAAGTLFDRKPRKPGGFMDRMYKQLEQKQKQMQQRQGRK